MIDSGCLPVLRFLGFSYYFLVAFEFPITSLCYLYIQREKDILKGTSHLVNARDTRLTPSSWTFPLPLCCTFPSWLQLLTDTNSQVTSKYLISLSSEKQCLSELIFYCCTTNYHKPNSLKQLPFIFSFIFNQFQRSENWYSMTGRECDSVQSITN